MPYQTFGLDPGAGPPAAIYGICRWRTKVEPPLRPRYRPTPMSTSEPPSALTYARGVARILGVLGDAPSAEQLAVRACQAARTELGVAAAALFVGRGDDGPD